MDRLRKWREAFRLKVRKFVKYNWHNEPEGDKFRSWDVLFVLGAVRYKPTLKWQRACWNVYRFALVFSYTILALKAMEELSDGFDWTKAIWHATVLIATGLCFAKESILNRNYESIQTVRSFINSNPFGSGDSMFDMANDSAYRKKCFQRLQLAALLHFVAILNNFTVFNVPQFGIDAIYGTPRIFQHLGPTVAKSIHFLFLLTFAQLWMSRFSVGTATICSLLHGFNTEYEIFVRSFDNILDNVYSDVEAELPSTLKTGAPEWKRYHRDELYWMNLKRRVNDQVKLHMQLVENMDVLSSVVEIFFAIVYYNAMVFISPVIYVLVNNGLSGSSVILVSGFAAVLLECYMWCRIVDSLKDTNEKLELKIMDLIASIPRSEYHRKSYSEMRTTLCILKTFVRNHEPFSCGGVFPLSVQVFADLLNISYTVFTFLRDMGKNLG